MSDLEFVRNKDADFVSSALDAIHFKLVRTSEELDDDKKDENTFKPELAHQLYGDQETIFGYKNLNVRLFYGAGSLTTFIGFDFSKKSKSSDFSGIDPDDVLAPIIEKIPKGFTENFDDFRKRVDIEEKEFRPFGEMIHKYSRTCSTQPSAQQNGDIGDDAVEGSKNFEIYRSTVEHDGTKLIRYHERLQTFILWYIDAANFISLDDDRWRFYFAFERYTSDNGEVRYAIIGYATVYNFYAYPENLRPRISQMLVLPPFQGQQHGADLLRAVYADLRKDSKVMDLTVEDPSPEFQSLRDFVDCDNCRNLPAFKPEKLRGGFGMEMATGACNTFLVNRKQSRRVYEILRFLATNQHDEKEMKNYRIDVKRRLNLPFQRQQADEAKLKRALTPEEFQAMGGCLSVKERRDCVDNSYQNLIVQYQRVADRLSGVTPATRSERAVVTNGDLTPQQSAKLAKV